MVDVSYISNKQKRRGWKDLTAYCEATSQGI